MQSNEADQPILDRSNIPGSANCVGAKCPECKEEITDLNSYSEIVQTFSLTHDGRPEYFGLDYCTGDGCYSCPEEEGQAVMPNEAVGD
jgi:hypothetical protein